MNARAADTPIASVGEAEHAIANLNTIMDRLVGNGRGRDRARARRPIAATRPNWTRPRPSSAAAMPPKASA